MSKADNKNHETVNQEEFMRMPASRKRAYLRNRRYARNSRILSLRTTSMS